MSQYSRTVLLTASTLHPLTSFINVQRSYSTKNTDPKNEF